jgi:putative permease
MDLIFGWLRKQFSDPQAVALAVLLAALLLMVLFFGGYLAPLLAAMVFAYMLEGSVVRLERLHIHRRWSALLISNLLIISFLILIFALVPALMRQAGQFMSELPDLVMRSQAYLMGLTERYPDLFTQAQINEIVSAAVQDIGSLRKTVLSQSLLLGTGLMYVAVYVVLVPLLVYFMLKDKQRLQAWGRRFVPTQDGLISHVWHEVDTQLANYIRGKGVEVLMVWVATYISFALLGLNYAMLLSVLVGVSVLVPYLGAMAVTIPVAFVAYAQWGMNADFVYVMLTYLVIQGIDGNIVVPLLFSEAVDLHPVAIIAAVLFFGGIWGFWGVFFAIPLATVVNAVLRAWPSQKPSPQLS